jgi:hypothetical protein
VIQFSRHRAPTPAALSTLLQSPPSDDAPLDDRLIASLTSKLAATSHGLGRTVRLDAFVVERNGDVQVTPFQWSARNARRSLGTRVARLVVSGDAPDVLCAAHLEIDRQCDRARCGLAPRGSLANWLLGTSEPVRARCVVEASTWAIGLLSLVAPTETAIVVGIADAWFEVPAARTTLHARRDAVSGGDHGARRGILRLRDGVPDQRSGEGLAVDGVIAALASPSSPPSSVVGAWPDAGIVLALRFDGAVARTGARLLVDTALKVANGVSHRRLIAA